MPNCITGNTEDFGVAFGFVTLMNVFGIGVGFTGDECGTAKLGNLMVGIESASSAFGAAGPGIANATASGAT